MRSNSLTRRVLTIVVAAQLVCALLLSGFALLHERHTRLRAFDESLKGRSDSVLGAIQDAEDKNDTVTVDPRELNIPRGDAYKVFGADGAESSVLGGTVGAPLALTPRTRDGFFDQPAGGVPYRVYQRSGMRIIDREETAGVGRSRSVIILYAASRQHLEHEILEAAGVYTSIILLVIAGTGLLVIFLVRHALSPLQELALAAGQVSAPSLTFEAPAGITKLRELKPLADVLHQLLASLREAFAKERRFLGDAAHELKTGVAVVRSSVQVLMLKQRTPDEYSAGLTRVVEDIARVEALVAQMLTSSAADHGEPGQASPLTLAATVSSVLETIRPFAEARQVHLVNHCQGTAMVRLRPDHATALISNLMMNAIQHSDPGMHVDVKAHEDAGGATVLEVSDTGSGIGKQALPHVFERFYREDRSRSRETGGAGLGLSICKSIVDGAGGRIGIESQSGSGTKVTVTFIKS